MYSFSYLEPVCCSMSSSNWCFLTCIQVSQEAGQVVWYSHLFQNFPQFIMIHIVKDFGIVNKAEIDVFLELSWFFDDPADVGSLISGSSAFWKKVKKRPLGQLLAQLYSICCLLCTVLSSPVYILINQIIIRFLGSWTTIIMLILQMWKQKLREVKGLANKWQS